MLTEGFWLSRGDVNRRCVSPAVDHSANKVQNYSKLSNTTKLLEHNPNGPC